MEAPEIPDYTMLRRIGGGSYGEVYLARSVTGQHRAIKVVRREDFDFEKTFEREFQGIQRYEPVSRDHSGLVDILHVGRNDEDGFYFYVMELADNLNALEEEGLPNYQAHTLSDDLRGGRAFTVDQCVTIGSQIASALGHLHKAGLTHRDIKPSNIIFIKGKPCLADVGLVAQTGQRTFVGTEGYVPPEGPGTSSADLYALAMVLYQMHTQKERFDFPELPTILELPPTVNRDHWRRLNAVICQAGAPDPKKRYDSAASLVQALRDSIDFHGSPSRNQSKRHGKVLFRSFLAAVLLLLVGACFGGVWLWKDLKTFSDTTSNSGAEITSGFQYELPTIDDVIARPEEKPAGSETQIINPEVIDGSNPVDEPGGKTEGSPAKPTKEDPEPALIAVPIKEDEVTITPQAATNLVISSEPAGAEIFLNNRFTGNVTGDETSVALTDEVVDIELRLADYRPFQKAVELNGGPQSFHAKLKPNLGPIPPNPSWFNGANLEFFLTGSDNYQLLNPVSSELFRRFLSETGNRAPAGVDLQEVAARATDRDVQWQFAHWLADRDRAGGYIASDEYYRPIPLGADGSLSLELDDRVGTFVVSSEPLGAEVYQRGATLYQLPLKAPLSLTLLHPDHPDPKSLQQELNASQLDPVVVKFP